MRQGRNGFTEFLKVWPWAKGIFYCALAWIFFSQNVAASTNLNGTGKGEDLSIEAEKVLQTLYEEVETGLIDPEVYSGFLVDLNGEDNCKTWEEGSYDALVWRAMQKACPEWGDSLDEKISHKRDKKLGEKLGEKQRENQGEKAFPIHGKVSVKERVNDSLGEEMAAPILSMDASALFGSLSFSFQDSLFLYRRILLAMPSGGRWQVFAGNIYPFLAQTRISFISGRRFYQGRKGEVVKDGGVGLFPTALLDGAGISFSERGWKIQGAGFWNALKPLANSEEEDSGSLSAEAHAFQLGFVRKNFRLQGTAQIFKGPSVTDITDITVLGFEYKMPDQNAIIGGAISKVDLGKKFENVGGYIHGGWAMSGDSPDRLRLHFQQAFVDWANPLQGLNQGSASAFTSDLALGHGSNNEDTLDGNVLVFRRGLGEGKWESCIPVYEKQNYSAQVSVGSRLDWNILEMKLLENQNRLALVQGFGDANGLGRFSYSIGSGFKFYTRDSVSKEKTFGLGQILSWKYKAWKARATLILQDADYAGPNPLPLTLGLDYGNALGMGLEQYSLQFFFGDLVDPINNLRIDMGQSFYLAKNIFLKHSLRLPWSDDKGWASDMNYQIALQWKF